MLTAVLLMTMMAIAFTASADTLVGNTFDLTCADDVTYTFTVTKDEPKEVSVKLKNLNDKTNLILPSKVIIEENEYTVTSIAEGAFKGTETNLKNIASVTIPNTVTMIGKDAFRYTTLAEVVLPESVTSVGMRAFGNSPNLKSVTVNSNITSCGSNAFGDSPVEVLKFNASTVTDKILYSNPASSNPPVDPSPHLASVKTVELGPKVETIQDGVLDKLVNLETVTIDSSNPHFKVNDNVIFDANWNVAYILKAKADTFGSVLTVEKFNQSADNSGIRSGELIEASFDSTKVTNTAEFMYVLDSGSSGEIRAREKYDTSINKDGLVVSSPSGKNIYTTYPYFEHTHPAGYDNLDEPTVKTYATVYLFDTTYDTSGTVLSRKLVDKKKITFEPLDNAKAISGNSVCFFPGETLTIGQILARAGVVHVTCQNCTYNNVKFIRKDAAATDQEDPADGTMYITRKPKEATDDERNTKFTLDVDTPATVKYEVQFKFITGYGGTAKNITCWAHHKTEESGENMTIKLSVANAPAPTPDVTTITVYDTDKYTYKLDGAEPKDNSEESAKGVFENLIPGTTYYIDVFDKTGSPVAILPVTTLLDTFVPGNFVVNPDGTVRYATGDDEEKTAPAYVTPEEKDTEGADIVETYTYIPDGANDLTAEFTSDEVPTMHGTYTVTITNKKKACYKAITAPLEVGTYKVACTPTAHEVTAPTCTAHGIKAYSKCDTCGRYYDEDGALIGFDADFTAWKEAGGKEGLDATGHDWNTETVTWTWNGCKTATAHFVCKNDATHTLDVTAPTDNGKAVGNSTDTVAEAKLERDHFDKATHSYVTKATVQLTGYDAVTDVQAVPADYEKVDHIPVLVDSGDLPDGTGKWEKWVCPHCGEGYMNIAVIAKDPNGTPVQGAKIQINGKSYNSTGNSDANGGYGVTLIPIGDYDIQINYTNDMGEKCEVKGTLSSDGKMTGNLGKLSIMPITVTNFRCPLCPMYYKYGDIAFFGWVISFVHYFVHMALHLGAVADTW